MAETRPRYVNPPQYVTPPFVESVDPYSGLDQILSNLNNVPVEEPQSKLQTILNMIAQAASVGISNDPGAALQQQFAQQRQDQLLKQQRQQQQQDQLSNLKLQIGLRKADQLAQDQQEFKREQRQLALKREDRQFDLEREREKDQTRLNELAIRRDWEVEDHERKFRLEQKLQKEYANDILDMERRLNDVRKVDTRIANKIELTTKYRLSGVSAEMAEAIAEAELKGDKLSKEQKSALDKAAAEERQMKKEKHQAEIGRLKQLATGSRRGSGSGMSAKDIFIDTAKRNLANTIFDTQWIEDSNGRVIDLRNAPKDLFGQPDQTKIKRYLSPEENYTRSAAIAARLTTSLNPQAQQQQVQQPQPLPVNSGGLERFNSIVEAAKAKGRTPEQIRVILKTNGATDEQINSLVGGQYREVQGPPTPTERKKVPIQLTPNPNPYQ